eukprot:1882142-Rhodomonas_salina.3
MCIRDSRCRASTQPGVAKSEPSSEKSIAKSHLSRTACTRTGIDFGAPLGPRARWCPSAPPTCPLRNRCQNRKSHPESTTRTQIPGTNCTKNAIDFAAA